MMMMKIIVGYAKGYDLLLLDKKMQFVYSINFFNFRCHNKVHVVKLIHWDLVVNIQKAISSIHISWCCYGNISTSEFGPKSQVGHSLFLSAYS